MFSVVFLVSLLVACEKQEDILPAADADFTYVDSDGNLGYYFLDGRPVRYENFGGAFVMGQTVIVSKGKPTETGPSEIEVHSFTSLEDYFTFANRMVDTPGGTTSLINKCSH